MQFNAKVLQKEWFIIIHFLREFGFTSTLTAANPTIAPAAVTVVVVSKVLEAKFVDLVKLQGGRIAYTFIGAQIFNIFWTLLWSYLLFGGYIFPIPNFK